MNKNVLRFLQAGCLCIAATIPSAFGQTAQLLKVDIPFDFQMNSTAFPAGEYKVRASSGGAIVHLQSADHSRTLMSLSNAVQGRKTTADATLTFTRYGDRYFLSQIWTAGSNTGRELRKGNAERELARTMAEPATAAIAASIAPKVKH